MNGPISDRKFNVLLSITLACALSIVGGCNGVEQMERQSYKNDGYMGLSNSNPNLRTNFAHHNYQKDKQLMRQALRQLSLDKRSRIIINGTTVTVTVDLDGDYTPNEVAAMRSEVYLLLKNNVPRYNYRIVFD